MSGMKFDGDKPRMDLVLGSFSRALLAVGEVGTFGAKKYADNNWIEVANGEKRYSDAMLRHYFAERQGHFYDEESGLAHAAHTAWCALARLDLQIRTLEAADAE